MKPKPTLLYLLCLSAILVQAQVVRPQAVKEKSDAVLQRKLQELIRNFKGDAGIYVRNLKTGQTAVINADTVFPTASMVKVPILIGLLHKMERGELDYHKQITYRDSLLYTGESDLVGLFRDSVQVSLSKMMMLMITTSDNTASLWCQGLAGGGTDINNWLETNGFPHTRVNSRTPGREASRKTYGWGQTTPREMAGLLVRIREGKAVSAAASDRMYRNLTHIYWDGEALSEIPPHVQVASKQGAVDRSRSEVVLVNAPSGDYVFCVITKNQQDISYEYDNAGFVLLRDVSRLLWQHFEPKSPWKPAKGAEKFYAE